MSHAFLRAVAFAAILMPLALCAEPIKLKLVYYGSEQLQTYQSGVKPFVDAVNAEGKGLVAIEVYANGTFGKSQAQQPQLVDDGVADMAFFLPGLTPYRFPDNALLDHPGLFRDGREGTLVYTRLIAAKALRGYENYFVIGAYTTDLNFIHSRKPIGSLAALKGQKIRTNNGVLADALQQLGVIPTVLDTQKIAEAINKGSLDGTALSSSGLFDFGVERVATHHYLLKGGPAPLTLVINRKTFDSLPQAVQTLIRKYSGEWAAAAWIASYGAAEKKQFDKLKADRQRTMVELSPADLHTVLAVYRSMTDTWAAKSSHNRELLTRVETELGNIRAGQ